MFQERDFNLLCKNIHPLALCASRKCVRRENAFAHAREKPATCNLDVYLLFTFFHLLLISHHESFGNFYRKKKHVLREGKVFQKGGEGVKGI